MSLGASEEVRFYVNLLRNNLFGTKYDLYKIPGPPGYRALGERARQGERAQCMHACAHSGRWRRMRC